MVDEFVMCESFGLKDVPAENTFVQSTLHVV